jgi:predicted PhzF superfamily epimerase YddE/YHI9
MPATAFLYPTHDGFGLRWFASAIELELCGRHARERALWESGRLTADRPARFNPKAGVLTATREDGWIALDFPVKVTVDGNRVRQGGQAVTVFRGVLQVP